MTERRTGKVGFVFLLTMAMAACQTQMSSYPNETTVTPFQTTSHKSKALKDIDLTKIGRIAPKGRVQDKEFHNLDVVDQLLDHGRESIPFLIGKLDDETVIDGHVMDYWSKVTVGDVALIILSDFSIDSEGKETIPGGSWDEFLQRGSNKDISAVELLGRALEKHGRRGLKAKWQRMWTQFEDEIFWDDKERCFYLNMVRY